MGSEEVGVLRNLGKQSVWLLRRISAGEIIGGAADETDEGVGQEDEEDGEEEEEKVEEGADCLDVVDADDGHSPYIDPITSAVLGQDGDNDVHPIATMTDADLAKAKQHIINPLGTNQAPTNTDNGDGVQSPTPTYPVTDLEMNSEEGLEERTDEKATIHATLDMLITIIGEFYGQRDLLDGRLLWDEMP